MSLIESLLREKEAELKRLPDLYLSGAFLKEWLVERREKLEKATADLERERADLAAHMQNVLISGNRINEIEEWCANVRMGLEEATFEEKQICFTLLDVRGKLAVENGDKVVYVKCILGKQRVSLVATSPLSSNQNGNTSPVTLTARLIVGKRVAQNAE